VKTQNYEECGTNVLQTFVTSFLFEVASFYSRFEKVALLQQPFELQS
jgi:hypothetical protein